MKAFINVETNNKKVAKDIASILKAINKNKRVPALSVACSYFK